MNPHMFWLENSMKNRLEKTLIYFPLKLPALFPCPSLRHRLIKMPARWPFWRWAGIGESF
jgi:hypothetical protein